MEGLVIINETDNPLFKRKEFKLNIKSDSSPKSSELKELIAQKFSTAKENIKIKSIKGKFGSNDFIVETNLYESAEAKNAVEPDKKGETPVEEKPTTEEENKEGAQNKELAKPEEEPTQIEKSGEENK